MSANKGSKNKTKLQIGIIGAILVFDIIFFSPLFFPVSKTIVTPQINGGDTLLVQLPYKYELCKSVRELRLPFWVSNMAHGYPLVAGGEVGAFNPLAVIPCFFSDFRTAFHVQLVLQTGVAQLGTILLASFFSFHPAAAVYFAILFPFIPLYIMNYSQVSLIYPVFFLPLILYFMFSLIEKPKKKTFIFFSLSVMMQFLTCHYQLFLYSFVFVVCAVFVRIVSTKKIRDILKHYFLVLLGYIFGVFLASVQLFPGIEFFLQSSRNSLVFKQRLVEQNMNFSNLTSLIEPFFNGSPLNGTYPFLFQANPWEANIHLYYLPAFFLLIGLYRIAKSKNVLLLSLFVGSCIVFLLAFGSRSPLGFVYSFPLFSSFRFPTRFMLVFMFTLVFFSVYGFDLLLKKVSQHATQLLISVITLFSVFFQSFQFTYSFHVLKQSNQLFKVPVQFQSRLNGNTVLCNTQDDVTKTNFSYVYEGYKNDKWKHLYNLTNDTYRGTINLVHEVPSCFAIIGLYPKRLQLVYSSLTEKEDEAKFSPLAPYLFPILGATHLIGTNLPKSNTLGKIITFYDDPEFGHRLALFALNKSLPFSYFVKKTMVVQTYNEFIQKIQLFGVYKVAYIEDAPLSDMQAETATGAVLDEAQEVVFSEEKGNYFTYVNSKSGGYVVISRNDYPGWEVLVNGKKVKTYKTNLINWGFFVPPGSNTIEIQYIPYSFYYGLATSLITTTFLIVFIRNGFEKFRDP